MGIILIFLFLNGECHYKDFLMDGLKKKKMIILFEGNIEILEFLSDR